jgi:adenylate kinase
MPARRIPGKKDSTGRRRKESERALKIGEEGPAGHPSGLGAHQHPKRIVLLGPPGAGKGTQAQMLAEKLRIPRYATGDMLRTAVAGGTGLGKRAKSYMDAGNLVPDELVIEITAEALGSSDASRGFILDGFPRSLAQAEALERIARIDVVVNVAVPGALIKERLGGRRSCPMCGAVFHLVHKPSLEGAKCDRCGTALVLRNDDKEEVVEQRLRTYAATAAPLLDFYEERRILKEVDGTGGLEEVFARVVAAVEGG